MRLFVVLVVVTSAAIGPEPPAHDFLAVPSGRDRSRSLPCAPALSDDGHVIAFEADLPLDANDRNGTTDIYVLHRAERRVTLVSRAVQGGAGRAASRCPGLSGDGTRVVFESDASDLVADDAIDTADIFVADLTTRTLTRISEWTDGRSAMSAHGRISADGRFVAFHSRTFDGDASDRLHVYRASLEPLGPPLVLGEGFAPTMSRDGQIVAFRALPGAMWPSGLVVHEAGRTRAVGVTSGGQPDALPDTPLLSGDGRWLTYVSRATNLLPGRRMSGRAHVYLERLTDGHRQAVTADVKAWEGNGHSTRPWLDESGARLVFQSTATNLTCRKGDSHCDTDVNLVADVFAWERSSGRVSRVTMPQEGLSWMETSTTPAISANGRVLAFLSCQPIAPADDRETFDLYVLQLLP